MVRRVAYVFSYCNGVRENSVGVLRCLGNGNALEATLELFRPEQQKMPWKLYYFDEYGGLAEGSALWVRTRAYGKSELTNRCCRLCAEAGMGDGIVLVPYVESETGEGQGRKETGQYLCGRFDGAEVTEDRLRELLYERETGERGPAERLLSKCPSYRPCRKEEITHSVRVTPGELVPFEAGGPDYRENSFLLHGYYEYRHLLFGRRKRGDRHEYVVMVPGRYEKKESRLADAFGFSEFIPAEALRPEDGRRGSFGYWCGKM